MQLPTLREPQKKKQIYPQFFYVLLMPEWNSFAHLMQHKTSGPVYVPGTAPCSAYKQMPFCLQTATRLR